MGKATDAGLRAAIKAIQADAERDLDNTHAVYLSRINSLIVVRRGSQPPWIVDGCHGHARLACVGIWGGDGIKRNTQKIKEGLRALGQKLDEMFCEKPRILDML